MSFYCLIASKLLLWLESTSCCATFMQSLLILGDFCLSGSSWLGGGFSGPGSPLLGNFLLTAVEKLLGGPSELKPRCWTLSHRPPLWRLWGGAASSVFPSRTTNNVQPQRGNEDSSSFQGSGPSDQTLQPVWSPAPQVMKIQLVKAWTRTAQLSSHRWEEELECQVPAWSGHFLGPPPGWSFSV